MLPHSAPLICIRKALLNQASDFTQILKYYITYRYYSESRAGRFAQLSMIIICYCSS